MADDLGYESISVNGGKSYLTPNIDMLAKKGIRFINCHSEPICTPSRVRIMTGKTGKKNYLDLLCKSGDVFRDVDQEFLQTLLEIKKFSNSLILVIQISLLNV